MKNVLILLFVAMLFSCNQQLKEKNKALDSKKEAIIEGTAKKIEGVVKNVTEKTDNEYFEVFQQIIAKLPFKKLPVIEITDTNKFTGNKFLNRKQVEALKLNTIYPNFYKEGRSYKVATSYKVDFSKNFYSIVCVIFKGDSEMEAILINYTKNGKIIDHKVVSYDEIAEGWSRVVSRIGDHIITTNHILYLEDVVEVDQETYLISPEGKIEELYKKNLNKSIDNFSFLFKILSTYYGESGMIANIKTDFLTSKVLSSNKDETIIVLPEIATFESIDEFDLNVHILVVNNTSGKVTQAIFETNKNNQWTSDAIKLDKIEIDTITYILSNRESAFAIRTFYIGSSRINPYTSESLSLFVKYDSAFKKILNNYTVSEYKGDWDGLCAGEFIDYKKSLVMSEEKSNGYFDIIIKNKIIKAINSEDKNGDCDTRKSSTTETSILKFDGITYKLVK